MTDLSAFPITHKWPARYETIQWLMFQMGGIGPMFGQLGFFRIFAGKDFEDKRPRDRYVAESKRLLGAQFDRALPRGGFGGYARLCACDAGIGGICDAARSAARAGGAAAGLRGYELVRFGGQGRLCNIP